MPALDYSKVAAVYDDFCDFDRDLEFFRSLLARRSRQVLELMAGTGRMSVPLLEAEIDLTCLDSSDAMLAVLRRKLHDRNGRARLVCADVRVLPFRRRFDTVILPFNGFCELVGEEDQRQAMLAVAGVLANHGHFICTTHNLAIRQQTLDGTWHLVGEFPRRSGGLVTVSLKGRLDPATKIVEGQERIDVVDEHARAHRILVPLRFSLVSKTRLLALAEAAGLRLVSLCGDYDGSGYDKAKSPTIIATFAGTE